MGDGCEKPGIVSALARMKGAHGRMLFVVVHAFHSPQPALPTEPPHGLPGRVQLRTGRAQLAASGSGPRSRGLRDGGLRPPQFREPLQLAEVDLVLSFTVSVLLRTL
eukprot:4335299-Prymnesium_polylepis.1